MKPRSALERYGASVSNREMCNPMNQAMENELMRLAMSCKARLNVASCSR